MSAQSFQWSRIGPATLRAPLVGRASAMRELMSALADVEATKTPRIVTVVGASGLGKSRLIYEFLVHAQAERADGPPLRTYRASAHNTASSFGLFSRLLRARFGITEGLPQDVARESVRQQVTEVLADKNVDDLLYFLGQFLDLPFPDSALTRAVAEDPGQASLVRRSVLRRFLDADTKRSPVVMVLEDLHEAHQDTLQLLAFLLASISGAALVLCAGRPELSAHWDGPTELPNERRRQLVLHPLEPAESAAVMELLLAPCGVPEPRLVEAACAVAAGNPLQLERMVRVYFDTGVLEEAPSSDDPETPVWITHLNRFDDTTVPVTVEDAVEARVAALSADEQKLLERAACMGSVFWRGGLVAIERAEAPAVERWPEEPSAALESLRQMIKSLVERDYILQLPDSTFAGEVELCFKNTRERERIERGTAPADARRYHQILGEWLEHRAPAVATEEHAFMLARHWEKAGIRKRAALSYLDAGDSARDHYAHQKAAEHYTMGLELLDDSDNRRRLDALHAFGAVLLPLGRTEDSLARFREMLALAYRLDLVSKGGAAHNRIGRLYRDTGQLDEAEKHLAAGLVLFERANDERGIAASLDDMGKIRWMKGDYPTALTDMRKSLTMRRQLGDRRGIALSLNNVGLVLQDSGEYEEATRALEQSLAIRREIGDLVGVVTTLNNIGTVAQDQNDHAQALAFYQEAHTLAKEIGDKNRVALSLTNLGEALYRLGKAEKSIEILEQAATMFEELGDKLGLAEAVRGLGKAHLHLKDLPKARANISRSVELFTAVRSKVHLAVALRTLGEVTAAGGWGPEHTRKARDYFLRAIKIFEEIGNEVELARSYRSYAAVVRQVPDLLNDEDTRIEAEEMDRLADLVFRKLQMSSRVEPLHRTKP
jgi:tetratricopeptide (TPR) repeat protein